jgi:ubiquinone/menaquinone biosynthesis C-methylase UbiE
MTISNDNKKQVFDFWNKASCGEELYLKGSSQESYIDEARNRYELEPYIKDFANFNDCKGLRVLEVGVGLGADHQNFASNGADLFGIDLTDRAIQHTSHRLSLFGLSSRLNTGDAENLGYENNYFDIVYSWGVLHHSPDTEKAIAEVYRVLKPGGVAKIMIYNKWSIVGFMLWMRYGLLRLNPFLSMNKIYAEYLESPGTKAYTPKEANDLFSSFSKISISTELTHGDLLTSHAGQRHKGLLLDIARIIWPRWFIRKFLTKAGLFMLIVAIK